MAVALLAFAGGAGAAVRALPGNGAVGMTVRHPTLVFSLLAFGYAFLYADFSLIVYSFNESRLVTVWADSPPSGT